MFCRKMAPYGDNHFFLCHLPHLLPWPLFFLYFWPLKQWNLNSLFNLSPFCSSVSSLSLLWSLSWSNLHLFAGFLLHNQQFSQFLLHNQQFALSSMVSLCLCLCYQSKRVPSLDYQKNKKKSSLSLSTADLKIVNQWSLSTSKNYQISFLSLFFFVFFHFLFISSRSDHNFIPVYPKFIGKAKAVRNRSNLKNRSRFLKPYNPTIVCTAHCFLPVEWFLKLKKSQNWVVQGFSGRTVRSSPSFKTLGLGDSTCHATQ